MSEQCLIQKLLIYNISVSFFFSSFFCSVLTATYLATYIVDLILVLHEISMVTMATLDPPKTLSRGLVMDALATYKSRSLDIHAQVKEIAVTFKLEERIATVIRDAL